MCCGRYVIRVCANAGSLLQARPGRQWVSGGGWCPHLSSRWSVPASQLAGTLAPPNQDTARRGSPREGENPIRSAANRVGIVVPTVLMRKVGVVEVGGRDSEATARAIVAQESRAVARCHGPGCSSFVGGAPIQGRRSAAIRWRGGSSRPGSPSHCRRGRRWGCGCTRRSPECSSRRG